MRDDHPHFTDEEPEAQGHTLASGARESYAYKCISKLSPFLLHMLPLSEAPGDWGLS